MKALVLGVVAVVFNLAVVSARGDEARLLRYPHYHQPTDTPDKVDTEKLARIVHGLDRAARDGAPDRETGDGFRHRVGFGNVIGPASAPIPLVFDRAGSPDQQRCRVSFFGISFCCGDRLGRYTQLRRGAMWILAAKVAAHDFGRIQPVRHRQRCLLADCLPARIEARRLG